MYFAILGASVHCLVKVDISVSTLLGVVMQNGYANNKLQVSNYIFIAVTWSWHHWLWYGTMLF